jgi:hypothetical protein
MLFSVEHEKPKSKISESDRIIMLVKYIEVRSCLHGNELVEKEELESQQKQLESVYNSIMKKWH